MLCFSSFAAWVIQYLVILQANADGDMMVMDAVVTVVHFILALQEQIMRLSLPLPLRLPSASGQNIAFPPAALWVTIGLAVCLLVLLIALAAVCRRKIKESCEEARREGKANRGGQSCTLFSQGVQFICHSCVPNHTLQLVYLNAAHFIAVHSLWGAPISAWVVLSQILPFYT